jgi:hypothetical protein
VDLVDSYRVERKKHPTLKLEYNITNKFQLPSRVANRPYEAAIMLILHVSSSFQK